ncbi:MAG: glycoside hydrolase family 16 protein [Planctomycetales bacterium]|nr:glycoside hydrolase family 16 protein [Planctomycetales bacterium]
MLHKTFSVVAILAVVSFHSAGAQTPTPTPPSHAATYTKLAFSDEFNGGSIDPAKWLLRRGNDGRSDNFPGGHRKSACVNLNNGNLELKVYTDNNDVGTKNDPKSPHKIGWIESQDQFVYGYIEARIRFDSEPGQWGAFWLQSPTNNFSTIEATNQETIPVDDVLAQFGAEIDIVEAMKQHKPRVTKNGNFGSTNPCSGSPAPLPTWMTSAGPNKFVDLSGVLVTNLHWKELALGEKISHTCGSKVRLKDIQSSFTDVQGDWHTYGLMWDDHSYTIFVDNVQVFQTTKAISKAPETLLLTTQVGDGRFAGKTPAGGYGSAVTPQMKVDWVRWWQIP